MQRLKFAFKFLLMLFAMATFAMASNLSADSGPSLATDIEVGVIAVTPDSLDTMIVAEYGAQSDSLVIQQDMIMIASPALSATVEMEVHLSGKLISEYAQFSPDGTNIETDNGIGVARLGYILA